MPSSHSYEGTKQEQKKIVVLRSQNRTRDLSITMKLLQSNVINQLHQAEECIPKDALVTLMEDMPGCTIYIAGINDPTTSKRVLIAVGEVGNDDEWG
jgi:hypothetical protein